MQYPNLVPKRLCKTSIHLELEQEGLSEYGEPLAPIAIDALCNYQDGGKTIFTDDKKAIELTGKALFCGDICPALSVISGGNAYIFGVKRRIYQGRKARNPDGTVNYTEVDLI